jgi:hypothetical protein
MDIVPPGRDGVPVRARPADPAPAVRRGRADRPDPVVPERFNSPVVPKRINRGPQAHPLSHHPPNTAAMLPLDLLFALSPTILLVVLWVLDKSR